MVIAVSAKLALESVTVNVATRTGPVLAATAKPMLPFPEPEAPCVMLRNEALLTAPHVQVLDVLMEMDAEPPAAGNDVVVFPVMTWHPLDADVGLLPQAAAISGRAATNKHKKANRFIGILSSLRTARSAPGRSRMLGSFTQ